MDITTEEIKVFLGTPFALFIIMILGTIGSAIKQMRDARQKGSVATYWQYFVNNWPVTLIALGHNAIAFGGLIMTDTLNWASVLGLSYIANSTADMYPVGDRAHNIETTTKKE